MARWLRGARGAVFLVLVWTVGWGPGFGGLAELVVAPHGETLDLWPVEMAIPGFVGGIVFAALHWLVEDRRRFDDASFARSTAWGALAGLLLGALSARTGGPIPLSLSTLEMLGLATGLGAVAGLGTAVCFWLLLHAGGPGLARGTR